MHSENPDVLHLSFSRENKQLITDDPAMFFKTTNQPDFQTRSSVTPVARSNFLHTDSQKLAVYFSMYTVCYDAISLRPFKESVRYLAKYKAIQFYKYINLPPKAIAAMNHSLLS